MKLAVKPDHIQAQHDRDLFPEMGRVRYLDFLKYLHNARKPDWYFEIGTASGQSLEFSRAKSIAIDPAFRIKRDITSGKAQLFCFQMTSDAFFDSGIAQKLAARIDLAFLDGMHHFEFLLRDFIGTEKISAPSGMIVLHDCVPMSFVAAERAWDKARTRQWTGDVWKLIPILRKYRPDLTIEIVDCPPSGLVLITNLDPENRLLAQSYDKIVAEFSLATLTQQSSHILPDNLNLQSAVQYQRNNSTGIAIKIPAPRRMQASLWGEYHFANSLAKSLAKLGIHARTDCVKDWHKLRQPGEIDLFIRGIKPAEPIEDSTALMWVLSRSSGIAANEIAAMDHVFVASELPAALDDFANTSASALLHCTDSDIFKPMQADPEIASEILFVGAGYPKRKTSGLVAQALRLNRQLSVYGRLWEGLPAGVWKGKNIANNELGRYYASARVVLNDHHPSMLTSGFVNNRIFDVLACGVPVISDPVAGLPAELLDFVYFADTDAALSLCLDAALGESETRRKERRAIAAYIREHHSFDARAKVIQAKVRELLDNPKAP